MNVYCCARHQLLFIHRFLDRIFPDIKKYLHTFFFCFEMYTVRFSEMQYTSRFHELSVGFLVWGFLVGQGLGKQM